MSAMRFDGPVSATRGWVLICFPNSSVRDEFLRHVRLWNLVHDLPPIAAEPLADGVQVRLADPCESTTRLTEAFGGRPARAHR